MRDFSIQYCNNKCTREHWQLVLECKTEQPLKHDLLNLLNLLDFWAKCRSCALLLKSHRDLFTDNVNRTILT